MSFAPIQAKLASLSIQEAASKAAECDALKLKVAEFEEKLGFQLEEISRALEKARLAHSVEQNDREEAEEQSPQMVATEVATSEVPSSDSDRNE
eukprot:s1671_g10.t1